MRSATLIYNPVAGRNPIRREREIAEITEVLHDSGIDCAAVRTTASGTATELARNAADSGQDLIIVCGGDGTINEVVNGIALRPTQLAILPGGTANIITNELGLRRGPVNAARELPRWTPHLIALGRATGSALNNTGVSIHRYFLGVAGVGFDAYVVKKLAVDFKMSLGVVAYIVEGLRQLMRYSFPTLTCLAEGKRSEASFALIQRTSRYAGNFRTAPRQALANAKFGVSLFTHSGRLGYMRYAIALITEHHPRHVTYLETTKAEFEADSKARVYFEVDGELAGTLPASFEVVPDALKLLMPTRI